MEIITGYTGKPHVTSEQDRDVNIGVVGEGSYVLQTGMQLAAEVSSNNEIKIRDGVLKLRRPIQRNFRLRQLQKQSAKKSKSSFCSESNGSVAYWWCAHCFV